MWVRNKQGFTIVELLIVIVVIAILAAISIVAYNGMQQRARDTQRKSDISAVVKALSMSGVDKGPMHTGSGCGSSGNGSGWLNYAYPSPGSDINECLKASGHLSIDIKDPKDTASGCAIGNLNCRKYMKYTCPQAGSVKTYIFANLEGVGHTASDTDGTCAPLADTEYGMNYFVKIDH